MKFLEIPRAFGYHSVFGIVHEGYPVQADNKKKIKVLEREWWTHTAVYSWGSRNKLFQSFLSQTDILIDSNKNKKEANCKTKTKTLKNPGSRLIQKQ